MPHLYYLCCEYLHPLSSIHMRLVREINGKCREDRDKCVLSPDGGGVELQTEKFPARIWPSSFALSLSWCYKEERTSLYTAGRLCVSLSPPNLERRRGREQSNLYSLAYISLPPMAFENSSLDNLSIKKRLLVLRETEIINGVSQSSTPVLFSWQDILNYLT